MRVDSAEGNQAPELSSAWPLVPVFVQRRIARLSGRNWYLRSTEPRQASVRRTILWSGSLVGLTVAGVSGATWLAGFHAGMHWVLTSAVAVLVGWCVALLYQFVLVQPTLTVAGVHTHERHHRSAMALEASLLGSLGLLVSMPLGAILAHIAAGAPANSAGILSVLQATDWYHPIRLVTAVGFCGMSVAPIVIIDRVPEGMAKVRNANRRFIEKCHALHVVAYRAAWQTATGREALWCERYQDPPFNTVPLRRNCTVRSKGSLAQTLRESRSRDA